MSLFRKAVHILFLFLLAQLSYGQAMYTDFGKNRIGNNNYQWQILENDLTEIHYHGNGEVVARNALVIMLNETGSVEKLIGSSLSQKVQVVLYNNISEYRQSNIGIVNSPVNPAGYSQIRQNIFPVYFNGDYNYLRAQLRKALANTILSDLFYGRTVQERVRSNVLLTLPDWYYEGLLEYVSEPWDVDIDDIMRDKVEFNSFKDFNSLNRQDQIIAGRSIWYFLEQTYSKEIITNIIFWTQYERGAENALERSTGLSIKSLLTNWKNWYAEKYNQENRLGQLPRGTENSPKKIAKFQHTRFAISPNGKYLAIVTNHYGLVKVWLYNTKNESTKLIKRYGYISENIAPDKYHPIIAWHPDSRKLGIISTVKGEEVLEEFNILKGNLNTFALQKYDGIRDFCYSYTGDSVVLSAFKNGQSDLFLYDKKSKVNVQLTDDYYLDINPSIHPDGSILFASRRPNEPRENENILSVSNYALGIFKFTFGKTIQAIGKPKSNANYYAPLYYKNGLITCLTDETGVVNAVVTEEKEDAPFLMVSNYKRNVLYQDIARESEQLAELVLFKGLYYIYLSDLANNVVEEGNKLDIKLTSFRLKNPIGFENQDIYKLPKAKTTKKQDTTVKKNKDTAQKKPYFLSNFEPIDYELETASAAPTINEVSAPILENKPPFHIDYLLTQTDHSNLGFAYFPIEMDSQAMCVHPLSFNIAAEISDIFRNYVGKGGFRVHGDLTGYDVYFKLDILKHRLDYNIALMHRYKVYINGMDQIEKATQIILNGGVSYPISERSRISLSAGAQQDLVVPALDDTEAILRTRNNRIMATSRMEYVFDNSINAGINKVYGIRAKVYGELFNFVEDRKNMVNVGFDLRRNVPIAGELVWANRLAASFSLAEYKTIYYLGGIETWMNDEYNRSLNFARNENYKFLALAPNLRGFNRNISHGFSTGVFSSELRFPIVSHFYRAPVINPFFKSLTFSGFLDVGSAWNGINPYTSENPFNTVFYNQPNYIISVTSPRNPWLMGTGVGVRARVLGYLLKVERAWGRADKTWNSGITYFSIGLDF